MILSISKKETLERQRSFLKKLQKEKIDCAILFNSTDIFYLTRFYFIPTERPISFFIDPQGKTYLFVPALEYDHAEEFACVDTIHIYPEYPGICHPMEYLKDSLIEAKFSGKKVGIDSDGFGSPYGYRGPKLSELINAKFTSVYGFIEKMRSIKSSAEIELIKESCRWENLSHRLLQKYTKAGLSEVEISGKASEEATLYMIETLGKDYKPHGHTAHIRFRGQIGEMSAYPHAVTQNITLKRGDTLITGAKANVWGYHSELERTMFVENVSLDQEKYFNIMYNAQEIAFNNIKPGKPVSSVEEEVQKYFKDNGVQHLAHHHTGHSIGLRMHEAPFLDLGDQTIMQPGMVFTVEPGIYVKGLGGFRHSDTILVTEDGVEILSYYPRDLESLICI